MLPILWRAEAQADLAAILEFIADAAYLFRYQASNSAAGSGGLK